MHTGLKTPTHTQKKKKNHTILKDYKNLDPKTIEKHNNRNRNHLRWVPFT